MTDVIERVASWVRNAKSVKEPQPAEPVAAKLMCCSEFDHLMADRKKHFDLLKYENRPDEVVAIWADPLVMFVERIESRLVNGMLEKPPRTYLVYYNEEFDCTQLVPADWRVLETLMPGRMRVLQDGLGDFRWKRDWANAT